MCLHCYHHTSYITSLWHATWAKHPKNIHQTVKHHILILHVQYFLFWTQYGQKPLSTLITMYKTDMPTLPIFGNLIKFTYIKSFLVGRYDACHDPDMRARAHNKTQCGVLISHTLHCYTTPYVNRGWHGNPWSKTPTKTHCMLLFARMIYWLAVPVRYCALKKHFVYVDAIH